MPTFKFGEDVYQIDSLPTLQACEAEKALGINAMDGGSFSLLAVQLFVAMRQAHPERPAGIIADQVARADWLKVEVADEEEGPLGEGESEPAGQTEVIDLATTGHPL